MPIRSGAARARSVLASRVRWGAPAAEIDAARQALAYEVVKADLDELLSTGITHDQRAELDALLRVA
jgi:hypothetical protein